ncbi:MAG: hypothetical protein GX418_08875 [Clostridiales bacterium]|nr:hypothetical protein [Clostridiales bacterium]
MIRLHQLKLSPAEAAALDKPLCRRLAAERLGVPIADVTAADVSRRSVDARGRGEVRFTLTLDVRLTSAKAEAALAKRFRPNEAALVPETEAEAARRDVFTLEAAPYPAGRPRPVVVGAGPAGLFCALGLAARGARPLLLERGRPVEARARDIAALEANGALDPESNVLFGEGGAGAYSDGKLTCGLSDPHIRVVLRTLVTLGAPEDILISARPHIGTDLLRGVLVRARERLTALGGEVLFGHRADALTLRNGAVAGVRAVAGGAAVFIQTDAAYLAIGHSARDTYAWLQTLGVPMEAKPFAVGVRVEHPQAMIDASQYGRMAGAAGLPPAEYKLNVPTPDGRGAYTFCMCPGGRVINASSEPGLLNVNGMSLHARDGDNANAALLVGVRPSDFGSDDPLAGIRWQRQIEQTAFSQFGGYRAPCQRVGDFLAGRASTGFGGVRPTYLPGAEPGDVAACLPDFVTGDLRLALPRFGASLRGFDFADALLTAPETRSSSPVRLLRDARRQSALPGLYPLGEGAGYAGGIVSAAVDGLKAALDA